MRIDYDNRTISCSVGDLVLDAAHRRIGADRGEGFRRMWLGQEIHSRRAEQRQAEDPLYRPELPVSFELEVRSWKVEVSGRIDGISIDREGKRIVIEEVKSLHFDLELANLYRSDKLQRFLYQLMLYAYFLSKEEEFAEFSFTPQLVLIDLVTERAHVIDAPFEAEDVATALLASATSLVDHYEAEHALRIAKRAFADELAFPFDAPRPFQSEMIEAVERAVKQNETLLVSAPTGIGKTMAAIYPALRESLRLGKKLFFLTSKTMQQDMAVKALELLNDGSFRTLRIRAKQKMCANTEMICHEEYCNYASKYGEKMLRNNLVPRMVTDFNYFDPDVTFELARSEEVCPFEVSLELINEADVIICDYNYIFDPYVGLKTYAEEGDYGDCVIVIDEAHNLVDRGRTYYSPELTDDLLEKVKWHLASRPGCNLEGWEDLIEELRDEFRLMAESLDGSGAQQAECDVRKRFFQRQRVEWERLIIRYIGWKIESRIAEEEDPLIDFYFKLMKFANALSGNGEEFSYIIERNHEGALKLKIFCKDASQFLGAIIGSAHATIAMSATLEPFDFYRKTLGFPDSRCSELSLPSPFPRDNRRVLVISDVDTTYKSREQHYGKIANLVEEMAEATEGNVLVLFPSYAFLDQISARISLTRKNVMTQRNSMTDWERNNMLDALRRSGRGNVIMAVSGGMYAEGIDYAGDMLSAVFVVGPSLPSVSFEQELLKRYYDDLYGSGFEFAYLVPGMTRVVQSAGRVIRSERDCGVIALLCKRFTYETYNRYFPADWFTRTPRELVSKKPADEIRSFFEAKKTPQLRLIK